MAVGYLNEDWKDNLVATKERGRVFVAAVHGFGDSADKAVTFHKGRAFRLLDLDTDDFINAKDSLQWVKENKDYDLFDDEEFEDEIIILVEKTGFVDETACQAQGIDTDDLKKMWEDCNRYWLAESDDEDEDY